jgi:hypothetical protein
MQDDMHTESPSATRTSHRTTAAAVKEQNKTALILEVTRCTDPDVNHKRNADAIIPSVVNCLERVGIGFTPDFSLFAPSYITSEKAFVVVMPASFAVALRSSPPFNASTPNCIYKLSPTHRALEARERRIDTGFKWFTGHFSAGATDSHTEVEQVLRAALASINLRLMDCKQLEKKNTGGVAKAAVRVAFDITDTFEYTNLSRIQAVRLPSMAWVHLRPSAEFAAFYHIHADCLKAVDGRVKEHLRCTCPAGKKSGPPMSRASQQAANDLYRERALKRAREIPDPFA